MMNTLLETRLKLISTLSRPQKRQLSNQKARAPRLAVDLEESAWTTWEKRAKKARNREIPMKMKLKPKEVWIGGNINHNRSVFLSLDVKITSAVNESIVLCPSLLTREAAKSTDEDDEDPDKLYHFFFCFSLTLLFSTLASLSPYPSLRSHSISVRSIMSLLAGAAKESADHLGIFPTAADLLEISVD
ncbi:hypothetical protein QYF36_022918 [Acer negundo]|nr:hypothetical protein QYF36_022918 [Acer negundo]